MCYLSTMSWAFIFVNFWAGNNEIKPKSGSGFNKIRLPIEEFHSILKTEPINHPFLISSSFFLLLFTTSENGSVNSTSLKVFSGSQGKLL